MTHYGGMANPYRHILQLKKTNVSPARWAIRKAFMELYCEIPFQDISVKKLCEQAHVARTTFYANYSNTDMLLEEIEDALIVDLLEVGDGSLTKREDAVGDFANNMRKFVNSHTLALTALLIKQPDPRLIEKWKLAIKFHFWDLVCRDGESSNTEFILEILSSMAVASYTFLLKDPSHTPNQEEVTRLITRCLQAIEF